MFFKFEGNRIVFEALGYWIRCHITGKIRVRAYPARIQDVQKSPDLKPFYKLVLETALSQTSREKIQTVWDIGCSNWNYLEALTDAFPNSVLFNGLEIDPGRRLSNFYTRGDAAIAYANASNLKGRPTRLLFHDFLDVEMTPQPNSVFCFFFPFVSEAPCKAWGLPARFSNFLELLLQAKRGLGAGASIVSCHQGAWERDLAEAAYTAAGLKFTTITLVQNKTKDVWPSDHDTYVIATSGA